MNTLQTATEFETSIASLEGVETKVDSNASREQLASTSGPPHLGVLLSLSVTGFGTEGWRIAAEGRPPFEKWSFVGYPIATLIKSSGTLVGGHLPGIATNDGTVQLASQAFPSGAPYLLTDLNGDGAVDAAALVSCNRGGVPWPDRFSSTPILPAPQASPGSAA